LSFITKIITELGFFGVCQLLRHFEFTSHFAQIETWLLWHKAEKIIFGSLFQAFTCHEYALFVTKND